MLQHMNERIFFMSLYIFFIDTLFIFCHVMPTFRFVKSFWVHLSFSSRIFYVCFSLKISIHLVLEIGHVHKEGNAEATVKLFFLFHKVSY